MARHGSNLRYKFYIVIKKDIDQPLVEIGSVEIRGTLKKTGKRVGHYIKKEVASTAKGKYLERRKADKKRGWWWITQLE